MFLFRRLIDRALEWLSVEMERRRDVRLAKHNELMRPFREARMAAMRAAMAGAERRAADELRASRAQAAARLN